MRGCQEGWPSSNSNRVFSALAQKSIEKTDGSWLKKGIPMSKFKCLPKNQNTVKVKSGWLPIVIAVLCSIRTASGVANVFAWGANGNGQATVPSNLENVTAMSAGFYHNLASSADGSITAWGANDYGQANIPIGLSNVMFLCAGQYHSLAIRSNGTVAAWGWNWGGQTSVPNGLSNVVAVSAGLARIIHERAC
jgi:hypothetical protein